MISSTWNTYAMPDRAGSGYWEISDSLSRMLVELCEVCYNKRVSVESQKGEEKMVKLQKKQVKIISVLIALVFIGSVVALALTQSGSGIASAASSNVGVVDYRQIAQQHPQLQSANAEMQKAVQDAQKEFEEKSANMSDQEKNDYYQQTQQRLQQQNCLLYTSPSPRD